MNTPNIKSYSRIIPMVYAYNTPGIPYHEGWTKIGYTERQSVEDRINQQTHTAGIRWELAWKDNAMYKDGSGEYFTDHDFHNFLQRRANITREPDTEWFQIDGEHSQQLFTRFANRMLVGEQQECEYTLRNEQARAVEMTSEYFKNGGEEFLWNAKPRFGKTLASYDLVRSMGFKKVLIVTNRPSIANSWADDFGKFIAWRNELCFVSDTDALSNHPIVVSRSEYLNEIGVRNKGMVAFESLQGLKGSKHFGNYNGIDKLEWMSKIEFDLLIIDESQEGVDTYRTERAFRYIKRKHTLYLSGTPFKQLASGQFSNEQIFNWSYADEQEAKENFDGDGYNPYESLPKLCMYTYQLGGMIYDELSRGVDLSDDETVDYAFDLNEFFLTNESGTFIHEDKIKKFLRSLFTNEKYPFSTPELRRELSHTMWYLNRVASAKALKKMMDSDEFEELFGDYEVVIAAGDGRINDEDKANEKALDRVRKAIVEHDKTITLTVGQLTVGITVPEWSGVLMLCNMKSPSSYMQAAFRAQNPCKLTAPDGKRYMKENAYIFDFDPARTLIIYDEFANNLSKSTVDGRGTSEDRESNIKRLLNFFPVLGEDEEGKMVELDPAQVLTIPRKIKSQEVVRRGFLSNFLFKNISNIFGAPAAVKDIVEKLTPADEDPKKNKRNIDPINDIPVDERGEVDVPTEIVIGKTQELFGEKIYEDMSTDVEGAIGAVVGGEPSDVDKQVDTVIDTVVETVKAHVFDPVAEEYDIKKGAKKRLEKQVESEIKEKFEQLKEAHKEARNIAQIEYQKALAEAKSQQEVEKAEKDYQVNIDGALQALTFAVQQEVEETVKNKPQEVVERLETKKKEEEKSSVEEDVRAHLRGFSRTIPSFIMAYGDSDLTLANFDDYTEDDVFLEVTGITEEDFRFLRDGGDYVNEETGETEHFDGHLFDEVVFNDSIQEFLKKREQLANYFDETLTEDIFDYIPPQKTNQIFTPKWVVSKMVDELEINNPGCFDNPDYTFADLYMKSGLYITEIVKRLYKSEGLKKAFPDGKERIRHILSKQVYGMAPTRIIYLIATNYILGFDPELKEATGNFVQADAAEAAKNNNLQNLVDDYFG